MSRLKSTYDEEDEPGALPAVRHFNITPKKKKNENGDAPFDEQGLLLVKGLQELDEIVNQIDSKPLDETQDTTFTTSTSGEASREDIFQHDHDFHQPHDEPHQQDIQDEIEAFRYEETPALLVSPQQDLSPIKKLLDDHEEEAPLDERQQDDPIAATRSRPSSPLQQTEIPILSPPLPPNSAQSISIVDSQSPDHILPSPITAIVREEKHQQLQQEELQQQQQQQQQQKEKGEEEKKGEEEQQQQNEEEEEEGSDNAHLDPIEKLANHQAASQGVMDTCGAVGVVADYCADTTGLETPDSTPSVSLLSDKIPRKSPTRHYQHPSQLNFDYETAAAAAAVAVAAVASTTIDSNPDRDFRTTDEQPPTEPSTPQRNVNSILQSNVSSVHQSEDTPLISGSIKTYRAEDQQIVPPEPINSTHFYKAPDAEMESKPPPVVPAPWASDTENHPTDLYASPYNTTGVPSLVSNSWDATSSDSTSDRSSTNIDFAGGSDQTSRSSNTNGADSLLPLPVTTVDVGTLTTETSMDSPPPPVTEYREHLVQDEEDAGPLPTVVAAGTALTSGAGAVAATALVSPGQQEPISPLSPRLAQSLTQQQAQQESKDMPKDPSSSPLTPPPPVASKETAVTVPTPPTPPQSSTGEHINEQKEETTAGHQHRHGAAIVVGSAAMIANRNHDEEAPSNYLPEMLRSSLRSLQESTLAPTNPIDANKSPQQQQQHQQKSVEVFRDEPSFEITDDSDERIIAIAPLDENMKDIEDDQDYGPKRSASWRRRKSEQRKRQAALATAAGVGIVAVGAAAASQSPPVTGSTREIRPFNDLSDRSVYDIQDPEEEKVGFVVPTMSKSPDGEMSLESTQLTSDTRDIEGGFKKSETDGLMQDEARKQAKRAPGHNRMSYILLAMIVLLIIIIILLGIAFSRGVFTSGSTEEASIAAPATSGIVPPFVIGNSSSLVPSTPANSIAPTAPEIAAPTQLATFAPLSVLTSVPTSTLTAAPAPLVTSAPTLLLTAAPTPLMTSAPAVQTAAPTPLVTSAPVVPTTVAPTIAPTVAPLPTTPPTQIPTLAPTNPPTNAPTNLPTTPLNREDVITSVIFSASFAGDAFADPESVESRALRWVVNDDPLNLDPSGSSDTQGRSLQKDESNTIQRRLLQRYALMTIWFNTPSARWSSERNWQSEDECTWFGISCRADPDFGNVVVSIDLNNNNLRGFIPADIALLTETTFINLNSNNIRGTLPTSIQTLSNLNVLAISDCNLSGSLHTYDFTEMSSLEVIDFSGNRLDGEFPTSLYSMSQLTFVDFEKNQMSGTISTEIGKLTSLRRFVLFENNFSGQLPTEIGEATSLETLDLGANSFEGSIPTEVGKLTSLVHFLLIQSDLTGTIPTEIANMGGLETLMLSINNLEGPIPEELGSLGGLKSLLLQSCGLNGTIPESLGSLEELTVLGIGLNNFVENPFPSFVYTLQNLEVLEMQSTQVTGVLSDDIRNLQNLKSLRLHDNDLSGIPDSIGDLGELEEVRLQGNIISGEIPASIGQLSKLTDLRLSLNRFFGPIPETFGNLLNLRRFEVSRNFVSGQIPDAMTGLQNLELFWCEDNYVSGTIPEEIGRMTALREFVCHMNRFDTVDSPGINGTIPESIGELQNLQTFSLYQNGLTGDIPESVGSMISLVSFDVENNFLEGTIPSQFGDLDNLAELRLGGNGLENPLPEGICSLDLTAYLVDCDLSCGCCTGCGTREQ